MQVVIKYYIVLQVICQDDIWSKANPQFPGSLLPVVHPIRPSAALCAGVPVNEQSYVAHHGHVI